MCATLTKKFMDCMKDYQKAQVRTSWSCSARSALASNARLASPNSKSTRPT